MSHHPQHHLIIISSEEGEVDEPEEEEEDEILSHHHRQRGVCGLECVHQVLGPLPFYTVNMSKNRGKKIGVPTVTGRGG